MNLFTQYVHITQLHLHNPMQNVNFGYTDEVLHFDRFVRYGSLFGNCIGSYERNVPNKRTVSSNWNSRVLDNNIISYGPNTEKRQMQEAAFYFPGGCGRLELHLRMMHHRSTKDA